MLIFVTGVAGSGKSTLCRHLVELGHPARDADEGISRHVRSIDGAPVETPPRAGQTPEWAARHEFRFDLEQVRGIAARATRDEPAFLLGSAFGDDEVIALSGQAWFLDLGEAELRRRIAARPGDQYGHASHELDSILAWHAAAADRYEALGARRLDAARPVDEIAGELLAATGPGRTARAVRAAGPAPRDRTV